MRRARGFPAVNHFFAIDWMRIRPDDRQAVSDGLEGTAPVPWDGGFQWIVLLSSAAVAAAARRSTTPDSAAAFMRVRSFEPPVRPRLVPVRPWVAIT